MGYAEVRTAAAFGTDGRIVDIGVSITPAEKSAFRIQGMADAAIRESHTRVRNAINASGITFPDRFINNNGGAEPREVTVTLHPADMEKAGSHYDLPIAVAILAAAGHMESPPATTVIIGELTQAGETYPTPHALSLTTIARRAGVTTAIVPAINATEAALAPITVLGAHTLKEVAAHLVGEILLHPAQPDAPSPVEAVYGVDFAHVRGQALAKRALEVAAAGGHNILLTGTPGAGKSLMAKATASILPPLTQDERLEVRQIHNEAGLLAPATLTASSALRPFIETTPKSVAGLIGGLAGPGAISRAHLGVLFLDEVNQIAPSIMEALRAPMQSGEVSVAHSGKHRTYPAAAMLVAAMNPCKCGYFGSIPNRCTCTDSELRSYHRRMSGALVDRFDIFMSVEPTSYEELTGKPTPSETSAQIRERVTNARTTQAERYGSSTLTNAHASPEVIATWPLTKKAEDIRHKVAEAQHLTNRGIHRLTKVARTIADLAGADRIDAPHIAEAASYKEASAMPTMNA